MNNDINNIGSGFGKRKMALLFFKYSRLFIVIALLLILVSSYFFVLKPKYNNMKIISQHLIGVKQDELQKLELYLGQLKSFNKSYKNISELDREKINKIIPTNNHYEDLIVNIEDLVTNRNLPLGAVKVDVQDTDATAAKGKASSKKKVVEENPLPEGVVQINISISVTGINYGVMKNILADLEKNLRLMDVKKVDLSAGGTLILELSSYYFAS